MVSDQWELRVLSNNLDMSHSEKLCLQWNDFQENINSSFKQLRNNEELSDVTLVSDDGGYVGAHKVVLASELLV